MKQATFSIAIVARSTKKDSSIANLFARITYNSKRTEFSINRSIELSNWDKRASRVKGNSIFARKLNNHLIELRGDILQAYEELKSERAVITPQLVKARYLHIDKAQVTLLEAFEYHNSEISKNLAIGTARHYKTAFRYVNEFLPSIMKVEDIYLSQLTYGFITRFEMFLRTYYSSSLRKPLSNNTIMKHIQRVRKVVTLAVKLEWLDKDPFAKYKCNFTPSTRKYLSDQELAAFEGLDGLNDRLQYVKDLFVFSCYSGLVYIDTMRLTSKNLVIGIDGSKWIYTDRQKSTQPVRIPLLPKAEELIAKYRTDPRAIYSGTLFPTISNQRLNSYLKELASLASIDSKITFHVARHTFATTVALMNGLPIETLSKILGHSKITTTQIYAKVLHQKVSSDMTNLRMVIKAKEEEKRKKEEEDKNKGNSDSKVS
jgi:site-specific recombinase XerD